MQSSSRVQLTIPYQFFNGSYDKSITSTSSKTINFVNRIRRLSPANWRRRSHSSSARNQSYDSINDCSSTSSSSTCFTNTSTVQKHCSVTVKDRESRLKSRSIKRYHSSTSVGAVKSTERKLSKSSHFSLRELYELLEPCESVVQLREKFPSTFISLVTSYMRCIELNSMEIASLTAFVTNFDQKVQVKKTHRKTSNARNIFSWYKIINQLLTHLLSNENYAVKFILRKPGNQVAINELEQLMTRLIECQELSPDIDLNAILDKYDVHVISCVLTRLLRKNGPLFPDILLKIFLQIFSKDQFPSEDLVREQKKSLRMLFVLQSENMREYILKPLMTLLKKISNEPICQVDNKSLSVLFAPIFFVHHSNSKLSEIQNPDYSRAIEQFLNMTQSTILDEQQSIFNVPKLFLLDVKKNLSLNIVAQKNDEEMPPLFCSLRYCLPISPSPNKSQSKKIQRTNAFSNRSSPVYFKENEEAEESGKRMINDKKRNLDEEIQFRESLLAPVMKRPIITITPSGASNAAGQSTQKMVIKSEQNLFNPPPIRSALLDTQLNFRIRRRASAAKLTKPSIDGTSDTSSLNTSSSIIGLFDCIKGNKENELLIR